MFIISDKMYFEQNVYNFGQNAYKFEQKVYNFGQNVYKFEQNG